jgi:putative transposase
MVKKSLSDRIHNCPHCGLVLDRDLNASINILRIGQVMPKSKPGGEETTTLIVEQVSPMKQEAH